MTEKEATEIILSLKIDEMNAEKAKKLIDFVGVDLTQIQRDYENDEQFRFSVNRFLPDLNINNKGLRKVYGLYEDSKKKFLHKLKKMGFSSEQAEQITDSVPTANTVSEKAIKNYLLNNFSSIINDDHPYIAVDNLAEHIGIPTYCEERISLFIQGLIIDREKNGNVFIEKIDILKALTERKLNIISRNVESFLGSDYIVDGERIYSKQLYDAECQCAEAVSEFVKTSINRSVTYSNEAKKLNEKQKICLRFLNSSGLKIITGGAGTGKTTAISQLVKAALQNELKITACATTGKAADHLSQCLRQTGIDNIHTETVHKTFGLCTTTKCAKKTRADVVIVDEASMLGLAVAATVFASIPKEATVILCGDVNQIPSVEPGNVFKDLIDSNLFETVYLTENMRQKNKTITDNAEKINNGDLNLIEDGSFQIMNIKEFPKQIDVNTQIISPIYNGKYGIDSINQKAAKHKYSRLQVGDKVIFNANNYQNHYFNGQIGVIKSISNTIVVSTESGDISVPVGNKSDLELSYCLSVHKSQGSEFDIVAVVIPKNAASFVSRQLLYTAVTRAKEKVIIYADRKIINKIIKNNEHGRNSALCERTEKCLKK